MSRSRWSMGAIRLGLTRHRRWFYLAMAILTVATVVVVQMITSSRRRLTDAEICLFSVLQFVVSLVFSWIVASIDSEEKYRAQLRTAGRMALRRTREAYRTAAHLENLLNGGADSIPSVGEIAKELKANLLASQEDWLDILGDESWTEVEAAHLEAKLAEIEAKAGGKVFSLSLGGTPGEAVKSDGTQDAESLRARIRELRSGRTAT